MRLRGTVSALCRCRSWFSADGGDATKRSPRHLQNGPLSRSVCPANCTRLFSGEPVGLTVTKHGTVHVLQLSGPLKTGPGLEEFSREFDRLVNAGYRSEEHTSELQSHS